MYSVDNATITIMLAALPAAQTNWLEMRIKNNFKTKNNDKIQ